MFQPTLVPCQVLIFFVGFSTIGAQSELPETFGHAHLFHPLPDTAVGAHCKWEVKLNTVYNRIPSTITEILCTEPNEICGGNSNYRYRQSYPCCSDSLLKGCGESIKDLQTFGFRGFGFRGLVFLTSD